MDRDAHFWASRVIMHAVMGWWGDSDLFGSVHCLQILLPIAGGMGGMEEYIIKWHGMEWNGIGGDLAAALQTV
eukprot:scaffold72941_cov30-Prasinocladus_malaysianus.AAC.1